MGTVVMEGREGVVMGTVCEQPAEVGAGRRG